METEKATTSIDVYIALDRWVPASVSALLIVLVALAVVVGDVSKKYVPLFFVDMLKLNFPNVRAKDAKHHEVNVEGRALNPIAVFILSFCVLPLTLGSMFVTFWNVFLVAEEVRGDCVPNYDCYPLYEGRILQRTPVSSCSETFTVFQSPEMAEMNTTGSSNIDTTTAGGLQNGTLDTTSVGDGGNGTAVNGGEGTVEVRYQCYRFVFLYAEGISAAGGVLLFTALFSKLYFSILIALIRIKDRKRVQYTAIGLVWTAMTAMMVIFVVVNTAVPVVRREMFQTVTSIMQFLMYGLNLFIITVSGVVVTFGVLNC